MVGDKKRRIKKSNWRINVVKGFFILFSFVILFRLFSLQILDASFYKAVASGQHDFYKELIAERGSIYVSDWKDKSEYLAVTNEARAFVFAEPRKIEDPEYIAGVLADILGYERKDNFDDELQDSSVIVSDDENMEAVEGNVEAQESDYEILLARLSKKDDPYEPIIHNIDENTLDRILALNIKGINYTMEKSRSYPEANLGGHIFGFVNNIDNQGLSGKYGIEGYYNDFLSGHNGFIDAVTDTSGSWIGVGKRDFSPALDGGDVLLTIDRSIQYNACKILAAGVEKYDADSGSVIVLDPKTGKIIALCNVPDFDPSHYNEVENISVYNNATIFNPYEPGSVIKPLVMAGAIDVGAVKSSTIYEDTGEVDIEGYQKPIRNSDLKAHGFQTMTEVLEKSLNTGMIFVMRQMGGILMSQYYKDFGFGTLVGIDLDTEANGVIDSLLKDNEVFYAPASYGQGFTITLLQLASAYNVLANGGTLMQPYIVDEKRYPDGTVEKIMPHQIRNVISKSTAITVSAMLVSVVENGHAELAGVDGYYIAGKTGTAQVASVNGGYDKNIVNATFAGYGPVENPVFVMAVRLYNPKSAQWAADSSAPIFSDIAQYILEYFEVTPNR